MVRFPIRERSLESTLKLVLWSISEDKGKRVSLCLFVNYKYISTWRILICQSLYLSKFISRMKNIYSIKVLWYIIMQEFLIPWRVSLESFEFFKIEM